MSDSPAPGLPPGLTVSYSGIRGIVGVSLTPEVAQRFGEAFALMVAERASQPTLLLARDTRPSGPALMEALLQGLGHPDWKLVDLGVAATPTVQMCLEHFGAHGALIVTASHNPAAWNGFKLFLAGGPAPTGVASKDWPGRYLNTVLDHAQTDRLLELVTALAQNSLTSGREATQASPGAVPPSSEAQTPEEAPPPIMRTQEERAHPRLEAHDEAVHAHVQRVLEQVDVEAIRRRQFRVALDAGRGAGHEAALQLLHELGCSVVDVQAERDSEPLPENLGALRSAVVAEHCDLGLAQDLDADRLALVDARGTPAGEDFTLVLAVDHLLATRSKACAKGTVVVKNLSTTRAVDSVVRRAQASLGLAVSLVETRVGEVNLSRALAKACESGHLAFGGEGNGGVIWPGVSFGRDSLIGMAFVLECLATTGRSLAEQLATLPHFHEVKAKLPSPGRERLAEVYARVEAAFPGGRIDHLDGVRVLFDDGSWVGVRPSNTEDILRLVAESPEGTWVEQALPRLTQAVQGQV